MEQLEAFILSILDTDLRDNDSVKLICNAEFDILLGCDPSPREIVIRGNLVQVMLRKNMYLQRSQILYIIINNYCAYLDIFIYSLYSICIFMSIDGEPIYSSEFISKQELYNYKRYRSSPGSVCLNDFMKYNVKSSRK